MIRKYMDDLERRIDPDVEDTLWNEWTNFADGKFTGDIFTPKRLRASQPGLEWPKVSINQGLESFEMMALQQLVPCSKALSEGSGAMMCVRSNYGTGIMPTLFGAKLFVMDEETNTLPTAISLAGIDSMNLEDAVADSDTTASAMAIKQLLEQGVPDLRNGLGAKVFDMAEYYRELFADYPKIHKYVHIYHPDLQGPMDVVELLWGSSLFIALLETPALVKAALEMVTDTYIKFMDGWTDIVPFTGDYSIHWSMLMKGNIMVRDDSAMNLSPGMFTKFILPYDQRILDHYVGGAIHFCGRGDHYIKLAADISSLTTINMSQPEYNDMNRIYDHTVDRGINLIGLRRDAAEAALAEGRNLHGRVHCA